MRACWWYSDLDYLIAGQATPRARAWTFTAWQPKGTQDVGWIEANTIAALQQIGVYVREIQIMREGRAPVGFIFDTGAAARAACEAHAASRPPEQGALL